MKKVLITGASGSVGSVLVNELIKTGEYEITALDLVNKKSQRLFKKLRKKINVIYGDITDRVLMEALIKDQDYIINLASTMPPLGDNLDLANNNELAGVKNIVDSINKVNKECTLIYTSTTSLYGTNDESSLDSKIDKDKISNYALYKYKSEKYILDNLSKYTILRVPLVLNNVLHEPFMFNINKNSIVDTITVVDLVSAISKLIDTNKKVNKKVFNVTSGSEFRLKYNSILKIVLKYYGLTFKLACSRLFLDENYYSPILSDGDKLNDILEYRVDSLNKYKKRIKKVNNKRYISKALGMIVLLFKKKGD